MTAPAADPLPAWGGYALTSAGVLPVEARRVWPVPVFGAVLVLAVVAILLHMGPGALAAAAYALYPVALESSRPWRLPTPVTVTVGIIVVVAVGLSVSGTGRPSAVSASGAGNTLAMFVFGAALLAGVWTVGQAVRERREYAARAADRAVVEERLRIARELHDVVAHGMSLIAVKAGVANHVLRERPEEAHDAPRLIETTSRGALTELRHMLGVLRSDGDPPADLVPAPGLARLPELVDRAALAGVRVETGVRGTDGLPEGGASGAGHGLIGMRERTVVYGGTFAAGGRRFPRARDDPGARLMLMTDTAGDIRVVVADDQALILTTFDLDEYVYAGLRAGAGGFLLKEHPAG